MPTVSWIDDRTPALDREAWPLRIGGVGVDVATLAGRTVAVEADLDCTGGWWSRQRWDAVALADLFDPDDLAAARSIAVGSATGSTTHLRFAPPSRITETVSSFPPRS